MAVVRLGSVIQASDGNFYGTTNSGGTSTACTGGCGTVFKITPDGVETVIYSFEGNGDGVNPAAGLIQASDGNLYGTTASGGTDGLGTVFKVTLAGAETVIHDFSGIPDGDYPVAGLIQASDGNLYGTTERGGQEGQGSIFEVTLGGVESVFYSFATKSDDGLGPLSAVLQDSDGDFYGTTVNGGADGPGAVYAITPAGVETIIYSFTGASGETPEASLIQGSDGSLYGTTDYGNPGAVFSLTPAGALKFIYLFDGPPDGSSPISSLIQLTDGNFYGTTGGGGTHAKSGIIFKVTPSGHETILHDFGGSGDGRNPAAGLIQGSDGNLYGTTESGGASGFGTVFRIKPP
jgi:uncharacterized repeat protein (TIGR03803 family)